MNNRRRIIVALGATVLGMPLSAFSQQSPGKIYRIGFLGPSSAANVVIRLDAFRAGLRDLGYVEGKNIFIEYRWAEGNADMLPALAAQLVGLKLDVICAQGPQATLAAKKASTKIPIVFVGIGDPVSSGIVASLARPGGNLTGLSNQAWDLTGKRLELLQQSAPRISSVAVLWNGTNQGSPKVVKEAEVAARALKLTLHPLEIRAAEGIDSALQAATKLRVDALMPLPDPFTTIHIKRVIEFAAKHRLPAIYPSSEFVDAGGLMSYAPNVADQFRRAAVFVDKILKGSKPDEIPVEQPTKFEIVINLKTAKTLGIQIPQSIIVRADKVIE